MFAFLISNSTLKVKIRLICNSGFDIQKAYISIPRGKEWWKISLLYPFSLNIELSLYKSSVIGANNWGQMNLRLIVYCRHDPTDQHANTLLYHILRFDVIWCLCPGTDSIHDMKNSLQYSYKITFKSITLSQESINYKMFNVCNTVNKHI